MTVSYTHLDVYKRQQCGKEVSADAFDGVPLDVVGDMDLQISETEAIRTGKALKEHLRRDKNCLLYTSRCV